MGKTVVRVAARGDSVQNFRPERYNWGGEDLSLPYFPPYICGHCGEMTGGTKGLRSHSSPYLLDEESWSHIGSAVLRLCDECGRPTLFEYDKLERSGGFEFTDPFIVNQIPSGDFGRVLHHLPSEVERLWTQTRASMLVKSWIPAAMAMRSLLSAVAVQEGAKPELKFAQHVNFLKENNVVGRGLKDLIDLVRSTANEVIHELKEVSEKDARLLFTLCEHLLLDTYELKGEVAAVKAKSTPPAPPASPRPPAPPAPPRPPTE